MYISPERLAHPQVCESLESRLKDKRQAEKVLEVLSCICYRTSPNSVRLRRTGTSCLSPWRLSEMSKGRITVDEAQHILTLVRFNSKGKFIELLNLENGEIVSLVDTKSRLINCDLVLIKKEKDNNYKAKEDREQQFDCDFKNAMEMNYYKYKIVKAEREGVFSSFSSLQSPDLPSEDPVSFMDFFNEAESKVSAEVETYNEKIRQFEQLIPGGSVDGFHKKHEKLGRVGNAHEASSIKEVFLENKHIVYQFLKYYTDGIIPADEKDYSVEWKLDGVKVLEEIRLAKNFRISRRISFSKDAGVTSSDLSSASSSSQAGSSSSDSPLDLPYFQTKPGQDSVYDRWERIKQRHRLADWQLARLCLELYEKGHVDCAPDIKEFLVPLVILLLGKEPALDHASILSNFILLYTVMMRLKTFESALSEMPMAPRGGVSAKQFMLHIANGADIDDSFGSLHHKDSREVVKTPKDILKSHYLSSMGFIGNAASGPQRYDDVVSSAAGLCSFLLTISLHKKSFTCWDPKIIAIKALLSKVLSRDISDDALPDALLALHGDCDVIDMTKDMELIMLKESLNSFASSDPKIIALKTRLSKVLSREISDDDLPGVLLALHDDRDRINMTEDMKFIIEDMKFIIESGSKETLKEKIAARFPTDDEDLIGKWAIGYLFHLHPLSYSKRLV